MTRLAGMMVAGVLATACVHGDGTATPTEQKPVAPPPVNEARQLSSADAEALADFKQRIDAYLRVHQMVEAKLPKLPKETTPEVVDTHQRALEKGMREHRRGAARGALLTPGMRRIVRQVLSRVFSEPGGREMMATILDENPGPVALRVNGRYPDDVPLSTVPPQVLAALPKLPEELEYRFVGGRLILLDVHAHTIADYMDNAFPR
jgi:hypothetical protein